MPKDKIKLEITKEIRTLIMEFHNYCLEQGVIDFDEYYELDTYLEQEGIKVNGKDKE
jgi:hypothetical protein